MFRCDEEASDDNQDYEGLHDSLTVKEVEGAEFSALILR